MPEGMENEFMKRGYLLPDGCKDLIDVLRPAPASFAHDSLPPRPLTVLEVSQAHGLAEAELRRKLLEVAKILISCKYNES